MVASKSTAGSLKNWLNNDTLDPATILAEAEALIYQTLRHWKMKADETSVMAIGADSIALPTDFIDVREFRITGIYAARLRKGDERTVQDLYQYDGSGVRINQKPEWFYLSGLAAIFDSPPDIAYTCLMSYYARPAALSVSNTTNFLTTDAPRLLRSACMLSAVEFAKEVGQGQYDRTYWQQQFDQQRGALQAMSDVTDFAYEASPEFA